jgi:LEA14-like dessication related protein
LKAKTLILSLLGLTVAGSAVAAYLFYRKQITLLKDYGMKPMGVRVISWQANTATLEFTQRITNKSTISAVVTRFYSDVYLNGQYIGFMDNASNLIVPAKGSADIKVQITFAPKEALKNITSTLLILLQKGDVPYQMKGYAKIKSSFIGVNLPFEYKGNLKQDMLA